jgi:DNA-binding LytR/AlgR family response regulator
MRILIVEDEKHARDNLEALVLELEPAWDIAAKLDAVRNTVEWLGNNRADLIFLDIHLADDLSFRIFEQIKVETPVIFTTAYDQYALQAFKVNSVDYLLKPIDKQELKSALEKFKNTRTPVLPDLQILLKALQTPNAPRYQERFLVQQGEKVMSVPVGEVAYFEGEDRYVYLIKKDGKRFIVNYKLSDVDELLNPSDFFRLNRSFIARFDCIKSILNLSKSRVKVELEPAAKREIIVSSENTQAFKAWLNQ